VVNINALDIKALFATSVALKSQSLKFAVID